MRGLRRWTEGDLAFEQLEPSLFSRFWKWLRRRVESGQ